MRQYAGKTIYIGIDVHKKTYFITAICGNRSRGRVRARAHVLFSPDAALRPFDHVIAADHSRAVGKGEVVYLDRSQSVVQSFENYLQSKWGSVQPIGAPDLAIPSIYQYQRHDKRIMIHPTSGNEQRNWPALQAGLE